MKKPLFRTLVVLALIGVLVVAFRQFDLYDTLRRLHGGM